MKRACDEVGVAQEYSTRRINAVRFPFETDAEERVARLSVEAAANYTARGVSS